MIKRDKLHKYYCGFVASLLGLTVLSSCQAFNKDIKM